MSQCLRRTNARCAYGGQHYTVAVINQSICVVVYVEKTSLMIHRDTAAATASTAAAATGTARDRSSPEGPVGRRARLTGKRTWMCRLLACPLQRRQLVWPPPIVRRFVCVL